MSLEDSTGEKEAEEGDESQKQSTEDEISDGNVCTTSKITSENLETKKER